MKNKFNTSIAISIFIILIGGCSDNQSINRYFPLKAGMSRKYKAYALIIDKVNNKKEESNILSIVTLPERNINDKLTTPILRNLEKNDKDLTLIQYITSDINGIYLYASQYGKNSEPKVEKNILYFIKLPIKVGTSWEFVSPSFEEPLIMTSLIENVNDKVIVPAGEFSNCLKIVKSGYVKLKNNNEIETKETIYYALDIGLVKYTRLVRKGNALNNEIEKHTQELLSYEK